MHAWQVPGHTSEPGEQDSRETGGGEGKVCSGEGGGSSTNPAARATPRTGVLPRESLRVGALVPARSGRDHTEELGVGDTRGGPVCLRAEGEETDQDNDEQTDVDPEVEN